jgi:hypothetical protein
VASTLHRLFAFTASLHVAPYGGFTTMLNPIKFAYPLHVRFGSKPDICAAKEHVRFAPNSDRESGPSQKAMSALHPKADMCSALADVC